MHLRQLMLKLALRRYGWERVKEIGQLHPTAHDLMAVRLRICRRTNRQFSAW